MGRIAFAGALTAAVPASACQTTPRDPPEPGFEIALLDPRVESLVASLDEADPHRTLRGMARLALQSPEGRFRRPQRVALRRPAELRVEILGLFGQIAAILVTDGERFQFWDAAGGGRMREGEVTPELLWNVARVDLTPEEAVDVLLGGGRPGAGFVLARAAVLSDGALALTWQDAARAGERREFDAERRLRRLTRYAPDASVVFEVLFDDYRELAGRPFAYAIHMSFPRLHAEAAFDFEQAELDAELGDELFSLHLPEATAELR